MFKETTNRIIIKNVTKIFNNTTVLSDINAEYESGKIYGITGHNGSGKTVLFKCICGFIGYESGEIWINNKLMGKDINILTSAGIIIEEPAFLRNWSAFRSLEFLYRIRNKKNRDHIYDVIRKVGLNPRDRKHVGKYSLGMKQRLAIAQAIMEDPPILILDEPMNGLDANGVSEMRNLLLEMKERGKLILLASHSREDILLLCDDIFRMENGRLHYA